MNVANKNDKYHVVSRGSGWAIKREGASKATSVHKLKSEAENEVSQFQQNHDVVIHNRDGTISTWRKGKK